jgi:hypothetical protein
VRQRRAHSSYRVVDQLALNGSHSHYPLALEGSRCNCCCLSLSPLKRCGKKIPMPLRDFIPFLLPVISLFVLLLPKHSYRLTAIINVKCKVEILLSFLFPLREFSVSVPFILEKEKLTLSHIRKMSRAKADRKASHERSYFSIVFDSACFRFSQRLSMGKEKKANRLKTYYALVFAFRSVFASENRYVQY